MSILKNVIMAIMVLTFLLRIGRGERTTRNAIYMVVTLVGASYINLVLYILMCGLMISTSKELGYLTPVKSKKKGGLRNVREHKHCATNNSYKRNNTGSISNRNVQ